MVNELVLQLNSTLVLAGNFSQIKFARSSWRETFLKLNSPARLDPCTMNRYLVEYPTDISVTEIIIMLSITSYALFVHRRALRTPH